MKTLGTMLKETRMSKHLSLESVEHATKIRKKFLEAIESDQYGILPSAAYAKGFVKNYSIFLGLPVETMLAFYRRQTKEVSRSALLPKGVADPLNVSRFRLTPGRFLGILVSICVVLFLLYFGLQYRKLQLPPTLTLSSPQDQQVSQERRVDVLGKTDADATVIINGVTVLVRGDGQFFDQVSLDEGTNTITISATSRYGKSQTISRHVVYQAP